MRGVWTVAEVRAAEEKAGDERVLMARAAAALARRAAQMLQGAPAVSGFSGVHGRHGIYGARVLLLVGSGNNGGDTLYAGERLARRGAQVRVLPLTDRVHADGLAAVRAAGARIVSEPGECDLILDGITGIGGTGGLRDRAVTIVDALPAGVPVLAVDLPSGVDADTGIVAGRAVRADVTVTFGCLKPGLVVGAGVEYAGQVEVAEIGLEVPEPSVYLPNISDISRHWPLPQPGDDKYTRGVVGVAAGSRRYPGAAVLAVAGASAGPSGYIRYAGAGASAVRARHPHVVTADRVADAGRVQAWVAGPGLSLDSPAQADLRTVLAADVPTCLDADALTLVAEHPQWLEGRTEPLILTPHDGEYERLAGHAPGPDRLAAARELAVTLNAIVLLKGNRTVIAAPNGVAFVNPTGTPALATAGTGDVLAGLLGSLLAGGVEPMWAAVCAAYAHGLAGAAAARGGPVTSPEVAAALRGVVGEVFAAP